MQNLLSSLILIIFDTFSLLSALYLAHFERLWFESTELFSGYDGNVQKFLLSGILIVLYLLINFSLGLYTKRNDFWEELRRSYIGALFLLIAVILILFITKSSEAYSRTFYFLMMTNLLWIPPLIRIGTKKILHVSGLWFINAYLMGNERQIQKLHSDLALNWYLGYRVVHTAEEASVVFIATHSMPLQELEALIKEYKHRVREVMLIPYLHNISFANAEIIDLRIARISFINIQNRLFVSKNILVKKTMEFFLVLLLFPFFMLFLLAIALLVKLDSRGPIFFRQKRLGHNGATFSCYKFRTMYQESDALLSKYLEEHPEEKTYYSRYHKYRNDPRITRIGKWLRKFSIDELPQLLNVLRFEMNLIGPRPYMLSEKSKLGDAIETILHVRPGLTGLWQISGRNDLDFFERVELDVWYIQNWSLWLDFIIFLKTFVVLVTRRGAR